MERSIRQAGWKRFWGRWVCDWNWGTKFTSTTARTAICELPSGRRFDSEFFFSLQRLSEDGADEQRAHVSPEIGRHTKPLPRGLCTGTAIEVVIRLTAFTAHSGRAPSIG